MSVSVQSPADPVILVKDRVKGQYRGFQAPFPERRALLVSVDALLVLLAAGGAFLLWQQAAGRYFDAAHISARWYWFPVLLGAWWVLAALNDLYDIPSSVNKTLSAARVAVACALGLVIYLAAFFIAPHGLPRLFFVSFLLIALAAITAWRWTYATVFSAPPFQHRVLIVGGGERARAIVTALRNATGVNYHVVGYVDDDLATKAEALDGLPVLGRAEDLPHLVAQLELQEIVVAMDRYVDKELFQVLVECHGLGAQVSHMPELYEQLRRSIPIQHIDPAWALGVMEKLPCRLELAAKRLLDVSLGLIGLLVFLPLLPLVALAIHLESAGPIFYRQIRCGHGGRRFSIFKFRTMCPDAEKDGQPRWATKTDDRVTHVGRFLRKTRLDELPQVLNILRGEMSIVGPRPERPEFIRDLQREIPFYRTRLMVKPGLTGWAQVHYDYGNSVEDALIKLQYDFYYLRYWSVWLDLYIIFRTFGVVLKLKGT